MPVLASRVCCATSNVAKKYWSRMFERISKLFAKVKSSFSEPWEDKLKSAFTHDLAFGVSYILATHFYIKNPGKKISPLTFNLRNHHLQNTPPAFRPRRKPFSLLPDAS